MDGGQDEENNNETNKSSWWGSLPSWLQTAKEKSTTAIEFMKRDLTEFSQVVQTDAVAAVSSTASLLKEKTVDTAESVADKARQSFTSVLETITDVFAPHKEIEDGELVVIKDSEPVAMDWWQSQLYLIRKDPKTYCHEPEGPPEFYENWLELFDADDHEIEMSEIMASCSEVRELYDKLVPASVSHLEFWHRYFYRVHLLRKAEAKRADLMRRAQEISIDNIEWDKDEVKNLNISNKDNIRSSNKILSSELKSETKYIIDNKSNSQDFDLKNHDKTGQNVPDPLNKDIVSESCIGNIIKDSNENKVVVTKENDTLSSSKENDEILPESSSSDGNGESRSSPIESLGKECHTSDEWEKDFDLEDIDNELKKTLNVDSHKEEDDWENWQ